MQKLFGTDGIRGVAGQSPLSSADVYRIAAAAGRVLRKKHPNTRCRVLGVRDTRRSSAPLMKILSKGLRRCGIDFFDAGVLSTPAGAFLTREHHFHSGVVVSASHNPPEFNGIKFFGPYGRKWPDEWEHLVEKLFFEKRNRTVTDKKVSVAPSIPSAALAEDYEDFVVETLGPGADLSGTTIAVDCSHGANFQTAPTVLRRLGARLHVIGVRPNGVNINVGCGSQATDKLVGAVRRFRCDAGIAFDGDGDRVILVDERGGIVDGDFVLALLAHRMSRRRELTKNLVVTTVMANLGLKKALHKMKIRSIETPVGDRHVSEAMRLHGAVLGGEQSGHIILGRYLPTGDGLLTALHVLSTMKEESKPLSVLASRMTKYPQILLNVPVRERRPLASLNGVERKIHAVEDVLKNEGRVLVRYSGTEPLLRIMLEGRSKQQLIKYAKEIAAAVQHAFR